MQRIRKLLPKLDPKVAAVIRAMISQKKKRSKKKGRKSSYRASTWDMSPSQVAAISDYLKSSGGDSLYEKPSSFSASTQLVPVNYLHAEFVDEFEPKLSLLERIKRFLRSLFKPQPKLLPARKPLLMLPPKRKSRWVLPDKSKLRKTGQGLFKGF